MLRFKIIYLLFAFAAVSCGSKDAHKQAPPANEQKQTAHCDLADIEESGEIIAVTMYGRNTYYEYHGKETGTAFELLSHFAKGEGMGVRIEAVADTAAMIKMLSSGEADIIAYPRRTKLSKRTSCKFAACGAERARL